MIVQRGFPTPPSFHSDRLRAAPAGHFFDVMTRGYGVMYPYASRVPPEDRWAIVAYVRAIQLSQNATLADVPPRNEPAGNKGAAMTWKSTSSPRGDLPTVGLIALCAIGAWFAPKAFFEVWLVAWIFWSGLSFGGLIVLMLQALTGGAWAQAVRSPCRRWWELCPRRRSSSCPCFSEPNGSIRGPTGRSSRSTIGRIRSSGSRCLSLRVVRLLYLPCSRR